MVGQTISHYKITEKLGEGGMGVVYKAEDTRLERPVALKFLAAHAIEDPVYKARFIREAKAVARLDHQNICSIYEIDEAEGHTFLAMAYIEGETLKDKIGERPQKLNEALDLREREKGRKGRKGTEPFCRGTDGAESRISAQSPLARRPSKNRPGRAVGANSDGCAGGLVRAGRAGASRLDGGGVWTRS